MQTKWVSFVESLVNVSIGYLVALVTQIIVFPWFDIHITFFQELTIGAIFTVASIARSYIIRRFFNGLLG